MVEQLLILLNFSKIQLIGPIELLNPIAQRYALAVLLHEFLFELTESLFVFKDLRVFVGDLELVELVQVLLYGLFELLFEEGL